MSRKIHSWTTICVMPDTREKLVDNRAPGQNYDGFIRQLVDLWEITKARLDDNLIPDNDYDNLMMQLKKVRKGTEKRGGMESDEKNQRTEAVHG